MFILYCIGAGIFIYLALSYFPLINIFISILTPFVHTFFHIHRSISTPEISRIGIACPESVYIWNFIELDKSSSRKVCKSTYLSTIYWSLILKLFYLLLNDGFEIVSIFICIPLVTVWLSIFPIYWLYIFSLLWKSSWLFRPPFFWWSFVRISNAFWILIFYLLYMLQILSDLSYLIICIWYVLAYRLFCFNFM